MPEYQSDTFERARCFLQKFTLPKIHRRILAIILGIGVCMCVCVCLFGEEYSAIQVASGVFQMFPHKFHFFKKKKNLFSSLWNLR